MTNTSLAKKRAGQGRTLFFFMVKSVKLLYEYELLQQLLCSKLRNIKGDQGHKTFYKQCGIRRSDKLKTNKHCDKQRVKSRVIFQELTGQMLSRVRYYCCELQLQRLASVCSVVIGLWELLKQNQLKHVVQPNEINHFFKNCDKSSSNKINF